MLADARVRRCYTVPGESFLGLVGAVEQHPERRGLPEALADAVGADAATLVDVRTDADVIRPTVRLSELLEADPEAPG